VGDRCTLRRRAGECAIRANWGEHDDDRSPLQALPWCVCVFYHFFSIFFFPVIVRGHVLGPGDGLVFYYPAFERGFSLWSQFIFAGFPTALDPQFLTWYPVRLVARNFNAFVISAYVLAGFFTYVLAWRMTADSLASLVAGLVYACGGFMIAHLGHTSSSDIAQRRCS
jgi:hypothetical protein